ncbi:GNAT family N-acetyltransferase [Streptomyces sp. NPDC052496]|uniref:GNAT family N-acetyltransferase n=1 Tax=Streptomyces sp. NPDC052496 TaxID=3154951 RepID=UPI0034144638
MTHAPTPGAPHAPTPGAPHAATSGTPHVSTSGTPHAATPGAPEAPAPGAPHAATPGAPHAPGPTVRHATTADLDAMVDLHSRARATYYRGRIPDALLDAPAERERWRAGWQRGLERPDATVLCAERDGAIVGIASYRREDGAPADTVKLFQFHVDPDHWRAGIGTVLHRACVADWQAAGTATAHLEVYWHNQRARAFYTRHGWQPDTSRRPAPDATHLDLILPLSPAAAR